MLQKKSSLLVKTLNIYGLIQAIFRKSHLNALFKSNFYISTCIFLCTIWETYLLWCISHIGI